MKIGDRIRKFVLWTSEDALQEEGIFEFFNQNVTGYRGCQSETCSHHSHGAYAPLWELKPMQPLLYLGQTVGEPEGAGNYYSTFDYYQMGDTFFCLQEGYHKHDKVTVVDVTDVPAELYDDIQDMLPETPRTPQQKRPRPERTPRPGRPERPQEDRRSATVAAKTREDIAKWAKAKPEGASDFVNTLLEREYQKEQGNVSGQ